MKVQDSIDKLNSELQISLSDTTSWEQKENKEKLGQQLMELGRQLREQERIREDLKITIITKDNEEHTGYLVHASYEPESGIILRKKSWGKKNEEIDAGKFEEDGTILFKGDEIVRVIFNSDFFKVDSALERIYRFFDIRMVFRKTRKR